MIQALCIVCAVLLVMVLLSRASEPSAVLAEQGRTASAMATVVVLQTQVARYPTPTVRPCTGAGPYFYPPTC